MPTTNAATTPRMASVARPVVRYVATRTSENASVCTTAYGSPSSCRAGGSVV